MAIVLLVRQPTRVLGISVLLAGSVVGLLCMGLMAAKSLSVQSAAPIANLIVAGLGGWAGFGIGAWVGIAICLPVFFLVVVVRRLLSAQSSDRR